MSALFHDVVLDYHVPIISQQGEVAGRLQVQIERISGEFPESNINSNLNTYNQATHQSMDTSADDCGFAEDGNSNMVIKVNYFLKLCHEYRKYKLLSITFLFYDI